MINQKFTPGPWKIRDGSVCNIDDSDGRRVAFADARFEENIPPYSPYGASHRDGDNQERRANATLISFAPNYYDAANDVLNIFDNIIPAFLFICANCPFWRKCKDCNVGKTMKETTELQHKIEALQKQARGEEC